MSEEQLKAMLAKLKEDAGLREKFQSAANLDAFLAMAQEAGFVVSKADWLSLKAQQTLELSDQELEGTAGGFSSDCVLDSFNLCNSHQPGGWNSICGTCGYPQICL